MTSFRRTGLHDRGAVLVWVAIMMVVLFGMAAIVIDAGALYQERRELQNGADAAALAVAQDCAAGDCQDEYATAEHFADQNAEDDTSIVDEVCGNGSVLAACSAPVDVPDGAKGWAFVSASTAKSDGGTQISFLFAPILNAAFDGETVEAQAIAAWGPPASVDTIPLTFSVCEYEEYGGSIDPTVIPDDEHYIYFHTSTQADDVAADCDIGPAGQDAPGGFGWLFSNGDCEATVTNGEIGGEPGNDPNRDCQDILEAAVDDGTIFAIPIFGQVNDPGANTVYTIVGFAGFRITGFKLASGNNFTYPNGFGDSGRCPGTQGNQATCIRGEFTEAVLDGSGGFGSGNDFGVVVVRMIG